MTRLALIHEWFTRWAGSEAVLEQILHCAPAAQLFSLTYRPDAEGQRKLADRAVQTSFIQGFPFAGRCPQMYLPLLPWAVEQLNVRGFDVVISNHHCVAKGIIASPNACHLAYVHSPARYAWDLKDQYAGDIPWFLRPLWNWQMHRLRNWDALSASRPDALACNSHYIARRIAHAWRRDAEVIYPPVDTDQFTIGQEREDVYVTASRMVGYKCIPLIAEAFSRMPRKRLRIIGDGADMKKVTAIAQTVKNIEVLGHVPREQLIRQMQRARAFIFAAEEDFGIAPVEAMACGTPVIAFGRGGAAESVIAGETGIFFQEQTASSLVEAINTFEAHATFDAQRIRQRAEFFSAARFREQFKQFVQRHAQVSL
jgi:glycosyltransferase involved in cell wall biosynthesis